MNIKNNVLSHVCFGLLVSTLSGCGSSEPEPDQIKTSVDTPVPTPETTNPPDTSEPIITPPVITLPIVTPPVTLPNTPIIEQDTPIVALPLASFTVDATRENNQLTVTWTDANADSYRVLFWNEQGELHEWLTSNNTQAIPSPLSTQAGQIIVEAYDALGSSIFSAPTNMGAL